MNYSHSLQTVSSLSSRTNQQNHPVVPNEAFCSATHIQNTVHYLFLSQTSTCHLYMTGMQFSPRTCSVSNISCDQTVLVRINLSQILNTLDYFRYISLKCLSVVPCRRWSLCQHSNLPFEVLVFLDTLHCTVEQNPYCGYSCGW